MILWETVNDYDQLSHRAASILLEHVERNPEARLGLPTGSTPVGMYSGVARFCGERYRCFRDVVTFNLDEYVGIPRQHPGSYFSFMKQHLFDHVDVREENTHVPCGDPSLLLARHGPDLEDALAAECERYESDIEREGGIDLMFLGLGSNAHIAFNEPGTSFDSRTHVIELDPSTISANAAFFPGEQVPGKAITMGIGTILAARRIVVLASGERKRNAIAQLRSGEISPAVPASALHRHPDVLVLCDRSAAGES